MFFSLHSLGHGVGAVPSLRLRLSLLPASGVICSLSPQRLPSQEMGWGLKEKKRHIPAPKRPVLGHDETRWNERHLRSSPSWRAPKRTPVRASLKFPSVLCRHLQSPLLSGCDQPCGHIADQSAGLTNASLASLPPEREGKIMKEMI